MDFNDINKRITIVGKFTTSKEPRVFVFNKEKKNLSREHFFNEIKPTMASKNDGFTVEFGSGKSSYVRYEYGRSVDNIGASQCIEISNDSILLELSGSKGTEARQIQQLGLKLYQDLISDLNFITAFFHPNFSKTLLFVASTYMEKHVSTSKEIEEEKKHKLFRKNEWLNALKNNPMLNQAILKYLTCYDQDNQTCLLEFEKRLAETKSKGLIELSESNPNHIELFSQALKDCKTTLNEFKHDLPPSDKVSIFQHYKKMSKEYLFLENFSIKNDTDQEYIFDVPSTDSLRKVSNDNFVEYYRSFKHISDRIHRVVRATPLHPFMFCGLTSKYKTHNASNARELEKVAKKMFATLKDSFPNYTKSEVDNEIRQNLDIINKTSVNKDLMKKFASKLEDKSQDDIEKLVGLVTLFFKDIKEKIRDKVIPQRCFTKEDLQNILMKTFQFLGLQSASFMIEKIEEVDKLIDKLFKFYQKILSANNIDDIDKLKDELLEGYPENSQESKFIDQIFQKVKQDNPTEGINDFRKIVKYQYFENLSFECQNQFISLLIDDIKKFVKEVDRLDKLYKIHLGLDVSASKETTGIPMLTTTDYLFNQDEYKTGHLSKRKEIIVDESQKNMKSKSYETQESILVTKLKESENEIDKNSYQKIENKEKIVLNVLDDTNEIGTIEIGPNETKIERQEAFKDTITIETSEGGLSNLTYDDLVEIPGFDSSNLRYGEELSNITFDDSHELAKTQKEITDRYFEDKTSKQFKRFFRGLIYGEYMLSGKDVPLGFNDVSINLGLSLETVMHLGEVDNPSIFDPEKDSTDLNIGELIKEIDFSQYIPIADDEDKAVEAIAEFIQYQYHLATSFHNISAFFQEVNEIGNFFDAVKDVEGFEVVYLDGTLEEHVNKVRDSDDYATFLPVEKPSLIYYIARQAADSSEKIIGYTDFKLLFNDIFTMPDQRERFNALNLPFIMTPNPITEKEKKEFPVISLQDIEMPSFIEEKSGIKAAKKELVVDKVIENTSCLILSASLMAKSPDFGTIQKPKDGLRLTGINPKRGLSVHDLLVKPWKEVLLLNETLILTKLINYFRSIFLGTYGNSGIISENEIISSYLTDEYLQTFNGLNININEKFYSINDIEINTGTEKELIIPYIKKYGNTIISLLWFPHFLNPNDNKEDKDGWLELSQFIYQEI